MKIIFAAVIVAFTPMAATAQANCAARSDVVDILTAKYGEAVVSAGVSERGYVLEMWGNPETGTWTAIATQDGVSCIVDQGGGFAMSDPAPAGDPA